MLGSCSSPSATPPGWQCIIAGTPPGRPCRFRLMSRRIAPLALAGFFGTEHLARSTPRQHRIAPRYIAQFEETRYLCWALAGDPFRVVRVVAALRLGKLEKRAYAKHFSRRRSSPLWGWRFQP